MGVAAQQTVVDNFYRVVLLPKKVSVRDAMLFPEQNLALLPATLKESASR